MVGWVFYCFCGGVMMICRVGIVYYEVGKLFELCGRLGLFYGLVSCCMNKLKLFLLILLLWFRLVDMCDIENVNW